MAYVRLSVNRTGDTETLASQEAVCRSLAEQRGATITEVASEGAGVSAKSGTKQRVLETLLDSHPPASLTIYASEISRLTRSARMTARLRVAVDEGLTIVTPSLATDSASGGLVLALLSELATEENKVRGARTSAGLERLRAQGRWHGRLPFGMTTTDDGYLAPDPTTGPILRSMIETYAAGEKSATMVVREANATHGLRLTVTMFTRALSNDGLAGYRDGQPVEPWTPLVPLALLHRARRLLAATSSASGRPTRRPRSLLGGFAVCVCGRRIARDRDRYRCSYRASGGRCGTPADIPVELADTGAVASLLTHLTALDPDDERLAAAAIKLGYVTSDPTPERDRLADLLAEIDARLSVLGTMLADGRMAPDQFETIAEPVLADQRRLRAALAALPTGTTVDVTPLLDLASVHDWTTVEDATWRAVLEATGAEVVLGRRDTEPVTVTFRA